MTFHELKLKIREGKTLSGFLAYIGTAFLCILIAFIFLVAIGVFIGAMFFIIIYGIIHFILRTLQVLKIGRKIEIK